MHKNLNNLVLTAFIVFLGLSTMVAILPAYQMQATQPLPSMEPLTPAQKSGLHVFVSENCVACHTQQVRNIEMDKIWGERPSMASDFYYSKQRLDFWRQSPSLLGSERTGPDLTNIGKRQPGKEWHLLHLFNPRIVVKESIMPSYAWLFDEKYKEDVEMGEVIVPVPGEYLKDEDKVVVASQKALDLVSYLQSLKQASLTDIPATDFIPALKRSGNKPDNMVASNLPDGEKLYINTCAACHQASGKGLPGAFPPLAGSPIVKDDNPELHIKIILQGYDARPEYGVMTGFADLLSDEEIAAIANHERESWGNHAKTVTAEEVAKIRAYVNSLN